MRAPLRTAHHAVVGIVLSFLTMPTALATTLESPTPGSQPLADEAAFAERLAPWCGRVIGEEDLVAEEGERVTHLETCDLLFVPERGLVSVQSALASRGVGSVLDDGARDSMALDDAALLEALGFDVSEMSVRRSAQLASQEKSLGTAPTSPRYLATKTMVERVVDGIAVRGHRAVVTRDPAGNLLHLNAVWPTLDATTVVHASETLTDDARRAVEIAGDREFDTTEVLVFPYVDEGVALAGVRCVESVILPDGLYGDTKPSARYWVDGAMVDPREIAAR